MKEIEFKIEIKAPANKVWEALWLQENYKNWTSVFCEGSYAESDWKEDSKILFLTPSGEGMFSKISVLVPNEKMYFTHIGEIKNFEEQIITEETQKWSGAKENYSLTENNGATVLTVKMDIVETHLDYFQKTFPKGLEKVKEMAEKL